MKLGKKNVTELYLELEREERCAKTSLLILEISHLVPKVV